MTVQYIVELMIIALLLVGCAPEKNRGRRGREHKAPAPITRTA